MKKTRELITCVYFLINKLELQDVFQNIKHLCNIRALQIGAFVSANPGQWFDEVSIRPTAPI